MSKLTPENPELIQPPTPLIRGFWVSILANLWSNKMDEVMKGVIAGYLLVFSSMQDIVRFRLYSLQEYYLSYLDLFVSSY
jgi:hypothetical protein